jgi:hypothetical protein
VGTKKWPGIGELDGENNRGLKIICNDCNNQYEGSTLEMDMWRYVSRNWLFIANYIYINLLR